MEERVSAGVGGEEWRAQAVAHVTHMDSEVQGTVAGGPGRKTASQEGRFQKEE